MDIFTMKICLDISILAKSIMGQGVKKSSNTGIYFLKLSTVGEYWDMLKM
jgi:hypothetical protein